MNERARQVQEAIELGKHGTLDEIRIAKAILETTLEQAGGTDEFKYLCGLANIYTAGRIQGIREERAKRKEKKQCRQSQ